MLKLKLKILFSIFFTLFVFATPLTYAWTQESQTGDWDICERTHFKAGSGSGSAEWHTSIENFTGYYAKINFSDLYVTREWWDESEYKIVEIKLKFEGNGSSFWVRIWFDDYQGLWGAYYGRKVHFDALVNITDWDEGDWTFWEYDYDLNHNVEFYFVFNNSHVSLYAYNYREGYEKPVKIEPYPNGWNVSDSWGNNVNITMIIEHSGSGHFEGFYSDEVKQITYLPEGATWTERNIWSFISFITDAWNKVVPKEFRDWINSLGSYFAFFINILAIVWNGITLSVQFFPAIILFWFIDAIITSVNEGDLQPIGKAFMAIYDFGRGVISTIVNIIHTIYDFIHFW